MKSFLLAPFVVAACASSAPPPARVATSIPMPAPAPAPPASASTAGDDLFAAIAAEDTTRMEQLLGSNPALVEATDAKGRSAVLASMFLLKNGESFHPAAENRPLQVLLAHHPTLDRFVAAAFADASRVRSEIARDPGFVGARHALGWTPLHFAAFADSVGNARAVLDAGADVNAVAQNSFRNTPLQVSTLTRSVEVARLLLSRGADVNHRQEGGFTALHEAVQSGSRDMVAALLGAGADPRATTDDGRTAIDLARARRDEQLTALLLAGGR